MGPAHNARMQQTFDRHIYRILLGAVVVMLGIGTVVYHLVEHFRWLDAYYFSVVTLATVGYGDYVPHTDFGKIFTTFYIFVGVGLLTTFISYTMRRNAVRYANRRERKQ
jgi:ABC-type microcin C transport system permease subunit YejB